MILVRFIFAVSCVTAFLVFTVYIRTENPRMFYECRRSKVQKDRIEQEIRMMKIEIESFKNPTQVRDVLDRANEATVEKK